MKERETRTIQIDTELKLEERSGERLPHITGYAARYNKFSEDLGGFKEIIKEGAFTRTLKEGADVRALVDHDPSKIIGRSTAGTLALSENSLGLKVSILPADTQAGRDIVESIKRGDVSGMSFGFRTVKDNWIITPKEVVRELHDVDLFDVSAVTYPAYGDTTIALRALDSVKAQQDTGQIARLKMKLAIVEHE